MKRFIIFFTFLISFYSFTQCIYDETCTISPAFPNICPMQLPDATAGEFYSTDLTFWMPVQFEAEGFEVVLTELAVSQIIGFPIGLTAELSNPSMVFYPSESEFGCAYVSGVPFAPGDYIITVYVVANVTVEAVGFEIAYPTEFNLYLTVNPGSGGNNSFTFSPTNGCEDLEVEFEALITSEDYDVEYIWDFGNGATSDAQFPSNQVYTSSGDYEVSLTTNLTSNVIELESFNIDWVSEDCYGGDAEELCWPEVTDPVFGFTILDGGCWSDPDLFIKIFDANGSLIYQTGGIGSGAYVTGTSASWSDINLTLVNPPYTVEIWDTEAWDLTDGLDAIIAILGVNPQFSQDDLLGTYNLNITDGEHDFNSGCSDGSYTISSNIVTVSTIENSETISVFDVPELETILNEDNYVVYVEDEFITSFQWYLDGVLIEGATQSSYSVEISGTYYVEFITENGCFGVSYPLEVVKCAELDPSIIVSCLTLNANINDEPYEFTWYLDDSIYGSGNNVLVNQDGYYWFVMTDESGCTWSSNTIFFQMPPEDLDNDGINNDEDDDVDGDGIINSEDEDVDGDGIPDELDEDIDGDGSCNDNDDTISGYMSLDDNILNQVSIFPNPSSGILNIILPDFVNIDYAQISLIDLKGQVVFEEKLQCAEQNVINLESLPASYYVLHLVVNEKNLYKRILIK